MPTNTFPADGNAGVGTDNPALGLLQLQLTADQASNNRMGLGLTVVGDNNSAMLYARPNAVQGGHNWYFTRGQQDGRGLYLDPAGNVAVGQNVAAAGNAAVGGTLGVTGDTTLSNAAVGGTLGVTGATTLGNAAVGGTLGVNGNTTLANATVGGTLQVNGNSTLANTVVGGTLQANGNTTLNNAAVGGTLGVTGKATLGDELDVAGDATFQGKLLISDDTTVMGALKIKTWELSVPDYVFEPGYRLAALAEVAAFVRYHRHLPEIPSAGEIGKAGFDAAQMILLLLKKIEELTLYLLQHEQRLGAVENRLRTLEAGRPAA